MATNNNGQNNRKLDELAPEREVPDGEFLTTNQGLPVSDNQNSLRAHPRGPTLLEDFILREKITHFDHERIPERIVHARGSAAHGYFELTAGIPTPGKVELDTTVTHLLLEHARLHDEAAARPPVDTHVNRDADAI